MNIPFDIEKLIKNGSITNELDYERAMIADRKLRLLAKDSLYFKELRMQLRNLIEKYEKLEWNSAEELTEEKIKESEKSEHIAELERVFIENRKQEIKKKLKDLDLTQENLALILGHKSKTHMSELINGIKPFVLKDLIVIHRVLQIDIIKLVPTILSQEERLRIKEAVQLLDRPQMKLKVCDLVALI